MILRENVEALFASMDGGIELRGEVATDTMVITRSGTRRLADYAFRLARERHEARQSSSGPAGSGEPAGEPTVPKVTCVDKANIFRSMAFFWRVFDEVANG